MSLLNAQDKKELKILYDKYGTTGQHYIYEFFIKRFMNMIPFPCKFYDYYGAYIYERHDGDNSYNLRERGRRIILIDINKDKSVPVIFLCDESKWSGVYVSETYSKFRYELTVWLSESVKIFPINDIEKVTYFVKNTYYTFEEYLSEFEKTMKELAKVINGWINNTVKVNIRNKELEQQANGASALQIKSNPENVVFCFGKIPRGFNLSNKPYNVYKGWHEDGKACMLRYGFKEPIILTDNINASGVVALSKRYPGKVMTYDEFLNGGKSLDTFESIAKQYSDAVRMNGKVVFKSKKYPNSYANLYEVGKDKVLTETCFDGNQKGLFKVKYMITDGEYTHNGVAKTWFYGRNGKPLVSVDQFSSVVDTLIKDAKQKAIFSQEDWNN